MAETYTSKRISELQEATHLTDNDLFVINEFSTSTGYTLTKKVLAKVLYEYAYQYILPKINASEKLCLSTLAYCDFKGFLLSCMQHNRGGLGQDAVGLPYGASLALSTYSDLDLGDLATLNKNDLGLDSYALKGYSVQQAGQGEYIDSISEKDGRLISITTGKFSDAVPIDPALDSTSQNAVQNAAIVAELNTKVSKIGSDYDYSPSEGQYIAGIHQKAGIIKSVDTFRIPVQAVDASLNSTSQNPVQNKAIVEKFNALKSEIQADANNKFVQKSVANSTLTALEGKYISSITQNNGTITSIGTKSLPQQATIDSSLNSSSTNAVQNKVITEKLNSIENSYVKKDYATTVISAPAGYYISSITQENGKLTTPRYGALPGSGMKYSGSTFISLSGILSGSNSNNGVCVFTAASDCIVSITTNLLVTYTSCGWRNVRNVWIQYVGDSVKTNICTMANRGDGLKGAVMLLKAGDKIFISAGCSAGHGTQYSISGTYLTRN